MFLVMAYKTLEGYKIKPWFKAFILSPLSSSDRDWET
jgi:hypothetical protein